jgi:hypothetical protein
MSKVIKDHQAEDAAPQTTSESVSQPDEQGLNDETDFEAIDSVSGGRADEVDEEDDLEPLDDVDDEEEQEVVIYDADAEDAAVEAERLRSGVYAGGELTAAEDDEIAPGGVRDMAQMMAIIESLVFVSEDPLPVKTLAEVLSEDSGWVTTAVEELAKEFNERNGGLMLREVAGGWQFATRPEHHEHIRAYLKSRPSAPTRSSSFRARPSATSSPAPPIHEGKGEMEKG